MFKSFKNTELPEEKNNMQDFTEVPDGENTIACTNLLETLNLSPRERIVGMKVKSIFNLLETLNLSPRERIVGMKVSLCSILIKVS